MRLRGLEEENRRLKHLVVDLSLDKEALKAIVKKNGWGLPYESRCGVCDGTVSDERAPGCKLVEFGPLQLSIQSAPGHNAQLREQLVLLARHRPRYGYGRLHALLTRSGQNASVQRVYRVYKPAGPATSFSEKQF
jgi:hypothetical protein